MTPPDHTPSSSGRPPEALALALADRYRIEREIGQGGMATVYLAHDVKHDRKVALKVLRPELSAILGADRFLAEIKTTANLQHPHILSLFDSGEAGGQVYYVMPYVEGESLRDRLVREKQLPVEEAVRIAREVADALDYAHRHGVIHRDIKPENILLHDGRAQVADFGIALAVSRSDGGTRMTETGMSLGTPFYMSPEQAMGEREITARSDVYALGCVTYEMLVGEPPFMGPTAQAIIARVMTEAPRSLQLQRHTIPTHVEAAIRRALEKLPADRFQSAAEFATALNDASYASRITVTTLAQAPSSRWGRPWAAPVALGAIVLLGVLAAWGWLRSPAQAPRPVLRYELGMAERERIIPGSDLTRLAISPDGSRLVYVGPAETGTQLWLRERSQLHATPIPNTVDAFNPVFSPDGRQLAFLNERTRVRVVSLDGGPAITVADSGVLAGGIAWGDDGYIYYDAEPGMSRIPAAGGQSQLVFPIDTANDEAGQAWASVLPGGKGVLFRSRQATAAPESYDIVVGDPRTGKRHVLVRGVFARYANSGHLLVVTADGNLLAAPFDPVGLKLTGPTVPLIEGIAVKAFGAVDMAVSASGTLIYAGGSAGAEFGSWSPIWVERGGKETPVEEGWTAEMIPGRGLALSPDGRRIALTIHNPSTRTTATAGSDIWVKNLPGGPFTRVTFLDGPSMLPFWLPGGERIGFRYLGGGGATGWWTQRADGVGTPDTLLATAEDAFETTISADGRWLAWERRDVQTGGTPWDIFGQQLGVDSAPRRLVASPASDRTPRLSPDGRWLAYASDESKRFEVYVRPFPAVDGGRWQVSLQGGYQPRWSPSGRELFFLAPDGVVVAPVVTQPSFTVVDRSIFMPAPRDPSLYYTDYEVHPDGRRLLTARRLTDSDRSGTGLIAVENFTEELKQRVRQ